MCCEDLRDLMLSGVRWELTEVSMAKLAAAARAATVVSDAPATNSAARVATIVVPPISPIQGMSVETAAAMAARPNDMDSLNRMIAEFGHPLRAGATNVVLPSVATSPNGMVVVTDMPGIDDDASGRILSGAAGELMDKMLNAIGMSRETVSIVPLMFWRTPGGRTPARLEIDLSRPFAMRALEILRPRVILTLGTLAAEMVAGINLARAHGVPVTRDDGVTVVPIYHPNYLLLKPTAKRDVWDALQNVRNLLKTV